MSQRLDDRKAVYETAREANKRKKETKERLEDECEEGATKYNKLKSEVSDLGKFYVF